MAARYPHVFSPLDIGKLTLANRIVRTAHTTHQPLTGGESNLTDYHLARARGGVALSILGASSVHPSAPMEIASHLDSVIPQYRALMSALEPYPMKVMQQLWHGGSAGHQNALGGPAWAASAIPNPMRGSTPIPMTQMMIDEMVAGFAAAAGRAKRGGLHGVELHAGHNYLIAQFLSPLTNRRSDDYGGSVENRLRFLREILIAVRAEVGDDFAVGVRISGDEAVPGGLDPAAAGDVALAVQEHVDFVDVGYGGYYRFDQMMATGDGAPLGYELESSTAVTRRLSVPTIVTGRIMTIEHAERIIREGGSDMVSMVRALIADPDLVEKSREGLEEQIRPCIGTNEGCVASRRGNFGCVVNPGAGREGMLATAPRSVDEPRRVLIGGGGPAGLETARMAALRGHSVTLLELTGRLGGQVAIAASAPNRADFGSHVHWLEAEVRRLGVDVRLKTPLEPDIVAAMDPDEVVVATGSAPRGDGFSMARPLREFSPSKQRLLRTSWEVLGFGGSLGGRDSVVVIDDVGDFEAVSVVEALLGRGTSVTLVSRHDTFGLAMPEPVSTLQAARDRLAGHPHLTHHTNAVLRDVETNECEIEFLGSGRTLTIATDAVVGVSVNLPNSEVTEVLREKFTGGLHVVGDALVPVRLREAIEQGSNLGREL